MVTTRSALACDFGGDRFPHPTVSKQVEADQRLVHPRRAVDPSCDGRSTLPAFEFGDLGIGVGALLKVTGEVAALAFEHVDGQRARALCEVGRMICKRRRDVGAEPTVHAGGGVDVRSREQPVREREFDRRHCLAGLFAAGRQMCLSGRTAGCRDQQVLRGFPGPALGEGPRPANTARTRSIEASSLARPSRSSSAGSAAVTAAQALSALKVCIGCPSDLDRTEQE